MTTAYEPYDMIDHDAGDEPDPSEWTPEDRPCPNTDFVPDEPYWAVLMTATA